MNTKLAAILLGASLFLIISCSPKINYLGDNYSPTQDVDIYFDEQDIHKEYKVMGLMKNEAAELELDDVEAVKDAMVTKAKSVGADAILFVGFYSERESRNYSDEVFDTVKKVYEAKLLKYY